MIAIIDFLLLKYIINLEAFSIRFLIDEVLSVYTL